MHVKKITLILVPVLIVAGFMYWFSDVSDVKKEVDKSNVIRVTYPKSGQAITSPVSIEGEARGPWFFEADFSIVLVDSKRTMIGETIATAQGEWMTEDFVPFEAKLYFEQASSKKSDKGTLIFRKHNASGLPEHNDTFELNVIIDSSGQPNPTIEQEISLPYEDEKTGMRFEYKVSPKGYILEELSVGSNEDPDLIKAIILTRIVDYEELQNSEGGREGPPTINVYSFKSNDTKLSEWLQDKRSFTNFTEDSSKPFVIGGVEGLYYTWDGLYQGETVAIQRDDKVYMIVGTYLSGAEDGRRVDFQNFINSFGFLD
jgi:hypothetical protein